MAILRILGGFHYEIVQDAPSGEEGHKQDRIQKQCRLHVGTDVCCIWLEARFYGACLLTKTIQKNIGQDIWVSNCPLRGAVNSIESNRYEVEIVICRTARFKSLFPCLHPLHVRTGKHNGPARNTSHRAVFGFWRGQATSLGGCARGPPAPRPPPEACCVRCSRHTRP